MRLVFISDTHNKHDLMKHPIPDGDVLIHTGDFTNCSKISEPSKISKELKQLEKFNQWFGSQMHQHKILIAGNHDRIMEDYLYKKEARECLDKCIYLENEAVVIDNVKFYGSPITPWFYDWAHRNSTHPRTP